MDGAPDAAKAAPPAERAGAAGREPTAAPPGPPQKAPAAKPAGTTTPAAQASAAAVNSTAAPASKRDSSQKVSTPAAARATAAASAPVAAASAPAAAADPGGAASKQAKSTPRTTAKRPMSARKEAGQSSKEGGSSRTGGKPSARPAGGKPAGKTSTPRAAGKASTPRAKPPATTNSPDGGPERSPEPPAAPKPGRQGRGGNPAHELTWQPTSGVGWAGWSGSGKKAPKELTTADRLEISGPTPNLFFQNGRVSPPLSGSGYISPRLQLPPVIHFFVRVKFQRVSFPFPPSIPKKRYLHKAMVIPGHEGAGPVAHLPFDPQHVIGLMPQHLVTFCQLVLEVPSTPTVNPTLHPTKISFHPRHGSQLHYGPGGVSAGTPELPRLIVPVWPHLISRTDAFGRGNVVIPGRATSAPPRDSDRFGPLSPPPLGLAALGTGGHAFGTSDGRMGPAVSPPRRAASPPKSPPKARPATAGAGEEGDAAPAAADGTPATPAPVKGPESPPAVGAAGLAAGLGLELPITGMSPLGLSNTTIGSGFARKTVTSKETIAENWARVAVVNTNRSRAGPFSLSLPGPERSPPECPPGLRRNPNASSASSVSAAGAASSRRLARSSNRRTAPPPESPEVTRLRERVRAGYCLRAAELATLEAALAEADAWAAANPTAAAAEGGHLGGKGDGAYADAEGLLSGNFKSFRESVLAGGRTADGRGPRTSPERSPASRRGRAAAGASPDPAAAGAAAAATAISAKGQTPLVYPEQTLRAYPSDFSRSPRQSSSPPYEGSYAERMPSGTYPNADGRLGAGTSTTDRPRTPSPEHAARQKSPERRAEPKSPDHKTTPTPTSPKKTAAEASPKATDLKRTAPPPESPEVTRLRERVRAGYCLRAAELATLEAALAEADAYAAAAATATGRSGATAARSPLGRTPPLVGPSGSAR